VSDFKVKVTAETQEAEKQLREVDKTATEATKPRTINIEFPNYSAIHKNFTDLQKDIGSAANTIQQFYRVAGQIPGTPVQQINEMGSQLKNVAQAANETKNSIGDAGDVIKGSLQVAGEAASSLVSRLTKIAFALYVVNEAAQATQQAFSGLFNETVGREIKLRETILKTQTTLASTSKVFRNGKEVTDPYEKIVTLTGEVRKNIDSIRERSIALAGVTSNEVIEVFGIVASQVGQIGGGLKEAEDLAINFSAALGTFGIPLYQARQEIGSILRADITTDSYLAKALGITNQDIAKAKGQAGGVVKFLEERLAAAVAGQRIAAEGFAGVVSNIKDLSELINQNFGKGLLDPMLDGLTKIFEFLFKIRTQVFDIAELAGRSIGTTVQTAAGLITRASGVSRNNESRSTETLTQVDGAIRNVTTKINSAISSVYLQIATLVERISAAFASITKGLANLALGLLSLKIEQLKSVVGAIEALSPVLLRAANALGGFLAVWGEFLKLPVVQQFTQIRAIMGALESTGVMPLIRSATTLVLVLKGWEKGVQFVITQFNLLRGILGGIVAGIGTLLVSVQTAGAALLSAWTPSSVALQSLKAELVAIATQLGVVGQAAQLAGSKIGSLNNQTGRLGGGIVTLIAGMIKFQLIMFAVSAGISLIIERFSAWKEAQDRIASERRVEVALQRLATTYKDVGENASAAAIRARDFERALVDKQYSQYIEELEKVREKINQINYELKPGIQSWGEFWSALAGSESGKLDEIQKEILSGLNARKKELEDFLNKVDSRTDAQNLQNNIRIAAQDRTNLEKEINGLRRQQESDLFQLRQQLASKEVEIFRAAGELRIFQMEQANKKMLEGQEGASAAALDALNNYLSTRERGELAIEAEKKQLIIEGANLQRQIEDYRFANEQKIQELKRAGAKYEQEVADYRRQSAEQEARARAEAPATPGSVSAATPVTNGFRVGSSGRSSGPHLDIRGPNREAVIREALAIIKYWQTQNLPYIQLSNAKIDVKNMRDDNALIAALRKEQLAHDTTRRRRIGQSKGAIDIAVPLGTLVPARTSTPQWDRGGGGWSATSLDTGNSLLHGADNSRASTGGAAPAASTTTASTPTAPLLPPRAPTLDAVGAPAVEKYADAVRRLASALERSRALQEALTNAQTKAAFDEIAKAAFPTVAIEDYDNQIKQARINLAGYLTAIEKSAGFDPERMQAELDMQAQLEISAREITEIRERAQKALNPAEYAELQKQLLERETKYNEQLKQQVNLRNQLVPLTRAVERVQTAGQNIENLTLELNSNKQALEALSKLGDKAYNPDQMELYLQSLREAAKIEKELPEFKVQLLALLERENKLRGENLQLTKATEAVQTMQRERNALPFELQRETVRVTADMARSFGSDEDFGRRRLIDAEVRIAERRIQLEQDQTLSVEEVTTELGRFAAAQRAAATQLAALDKAASDFAQTMGLIKEVSKAFTDGYKNIVKTALQGGDIGEAVNGLLQNVADKFLTAALDAAFKPIEAMWQEQLKGLFGVQDPMAALVEAQTRAAEEARTQEQSLVQQQQDAATKQLQAANTQLQAAQARTTPPSPMALPVDKFDPSATSSTITPATNVVATSTTASTSVTAPVTELNKNVDKASKALGETAASAKQTSPLFGNLSTAVTGAVGALASVAMGIAGFNQIKKGGTYNTLMGLAGIFGSLGSITGMFSSRGVLGGLFGGARAFGGPVTANRPYLVGELGPELFTPGTSGQILNNGDTQDYFKQTRATLGRVTTRDRDSRSAALPPMAPLDIRYESQTINNVEYVTAEQHRKGMEMAARRGQQLAYQGLQNSVKVRRRLGVS
jgi:hypothetical protein